jgi:hypothetical protein
MSTNRIEYLNIGLMLISTVAAFLLPFEVFLFSYAVLGPLHYLTEISWLHDRQYFAPRKFDWVPLAALGLLLLLGARSILGPAITSSLEGIGLTPILEFVDEYAYSLTFLAFGLAFVFVLVKDWTYRVAGIMVLLLVAYIFALPSPESITTQREYEQVIAKNTHPFFKTFAVYVPTLIHVYLFTGAFILFGALKRRSAAGFASFAAFIVFALLCLLLPATINDYTATAWAMNNYDDTTFRGLTVHLMNDLGGQDIVKAGAVDIFHDPLSIRLARFIAFAYTYHYLNWFSKTNIIQWHKIPKARFAVVIAAWIASVAIYVIDYKLGFRWLFLLSFLHVLLEFPLNHQSFIGIWRELKGLGSKQQPATAKS